MKIIIEGCDGSGKSTLAKKLATIFNARIEHDSVPQDYKNYLGRLVYPGNVIFDRFFIGQFVYNKPEERRLSEQELELLKQYCMDRSDVLLFYIDQDTDTLLKRLENRSREEKKKDSTIMSKVGKNTAKEFIETIKSRYEYYIKGFKVLKGEDINEF